MLRLVLRGESAGGCVLEVVMMIGFAGVMWVLPVVSDASSSGDVPVEGALGIDLLDRRRAEVDLEAIVAKATARSGWCMRVVSKDRRERGWASSPLAETAVCHLQGAQRSPTPSPPNPIRRHLPPLPRRPRLRFRKHLRHRQTRRRLRPRVIDC